MNVAKYIDHTILKPNATYDEIITICEEAKQYGFASVCVNQYYTKLVKEQLAGSDVKVCTVVGFPLGAVSYEVKAFETTKAIEAGADEIDMVINIGALKDKKYDYVLADIEAVVKAAKGAIVKVILETCLLTDKEKVKACELSVKAGANFVKTSTGFSTGGATVNDITLMRKTVGSEIGVKASGAVRDYETAMAVIEAGANRIGASAGIAIVNNQKNKDQSGY
ncbi:MAG: deoxyribose-phosphate aldolase [Firmicutes bacterium HGW-Firmicutes-1]|jgi:deoxyribose-phosphate aldolase|nr:MAG: deoxyribose-phosphate aldolase [Firmicutes bacterium HGW-Firmicutes-1]